MINRILVCLDKSTYTDSVIDYACWLAEHHNASLEGLVVVDTKGIRRSEGPVPLGAMRFAKTSIAAKENECHAMVEELLQKFSARCEAAGVRHVEFEMQGSPADAILEESNYFDCVIIGLRTFFTYSSGAGDDEIYGTADDEPGDSLEQILNHSLAPIFAVPLDWKHTEDINALIAINGGTHSMSAMRKFARLYGRADVRVTLMNCSDGSENHLELLTKSAAFLRAHQFKHVESRTESGNICELLTDEYCAPYDLIVLGAHGQSGIVDFFTGSLCKDLLQRATKPLLIANG